MDLGVYHRSNQNASFEQDNNELKEVEKLRISFCLLFLVQ